MADSTALENELGFFEQHKKAWLQSHPGEFVVLAATSASTLITSLRFEPGCRRSELTASFS